jgi:hypothetical protein
MRKLIGEWWELRWRDDGKDILVHCGWPPFGVAPSGSFPSLKAAKEAKAKDDNKFHVIVHVRRYELPKKGKSR